MKKKVLAILVSVFMLMAMFTTYVFAAGTGTQADPWLIGPSGSESNVTAYLDSGTLYINGTGDMADYSFDDEMPWYSVKNSITSVVIGENITHIGNRAFKYHGTISNVVIPSTVTSIGSGALYQVSSSASITVKATTPPTLEWDSMDSLSAFSMSIFAPAASVSTYLSAPNWSYFTISPIPTPVAKIGTTEYETLEAAINAASNGNTITILSDINYSDGPNLIIDNKELVIDLDGHTIKVDVGFTIPTTTNIFTIKNSGNLTVNNGTIVCAGMYGGMLAPFTVLGTGSTLTLVDVTQANNLAWFLTLDGGTATIDGGRFGSSADNFGIVLSNNANLTVKNNPTFTFQGTLFTAGPLTNTDPNANAGSITIESGTFSGAYASEVVKLLSKATVTINGGTYTPSSTENSILTVSSYGYKSSATINDITSNSIRIISSFNNDNIEEFAPIINGGYYKYNKGALYADRNNGLKANPSLMGGYFGPMESSNPVADDDALKELSSVCASGYEVEELESVDPEYANGYRYKIVKIPEPTDPESPETGINDLVVLSSISILALCAFMFVRRKKND